MRRSPLPLALAAVSALAGCGSATLPQGSETFDVPTYEWDRGGGNEAAVSGHLAFDEAGCTLMFEEGDEFGRPVVFPNATGVRYPNGVRAVVDAQTGAVFAIEGQAFSYAGGWGNPTESWTEPCGAYEHGEVALVNDEGTIEAPDGEPELPSIALPTRVATAEERGWYEVPTFEWDPAQGSRTALIEGTVTMTDDGCAVIDSGHGVTGLILPNAAGVRGGPAGDMGPIIYSTFPDGGLSAMAMEGDEVSFGGGVPGDDSQFLADWERLCPNSPVEDLFVVQDTQPWS